jgi:hypothetical protein
MVGPTVLNYDYTFLASSVKVKQKNNSIYKIENNQKLGGTGFVRAIHECCILVDMKKFNQVKKFNENYPCLRTANIDLALKFSTKKYKVKFVVNSEVLCKNQFNADELKFFEDK